MSPVHRFSLKENDEYFFRFGQPSLCDCQSQKKVVILVEMPWGRDKDPRVPLGHASILATLKMNQDIECYSVVRPINDDDFEVSELFLDIFQLIEKNEGAKIDIAIGVYVWAEEAIQQLLRMIRYAGFDGRIILGGPQISYSYPGLEEYYPEADIFVRGYGEMAVYALAGSVERVELSGIHYSGEEDLNLQTMVDLQLLPSPWLTGVIELENQPFIRWETQRGCPFKCGFCQHKEAGARLINREFASNRVMKEIDLFCDKKVVDIAVLDPIFNSSPLSTSILQRFLENGYKGRLSLQCRAEMINDEFIEVASELNVCLEFGLQTIHRNEGNAVNRSNNIRKVGEVFSQVSKQEIEYEVSLIYGLPEQTLESFQESIEWCLERSVPTVKAFPLMLLRGTEVEQNREQWGLVESEGSMPVVMQSDSFTYDEWCQMAKLSEALSQTEGCHPESLQELKEIARGLEIEYDRYRPKISLTNGRNVVIKEGLRSLQSPMEFESLNNRNLSNSL